MTLDPDLTESYSSSQDPPEKSFPIWCKSYFISSSLTKRPKLGRAFDPNEPLQIGLIFEVKAGNLP